jgi:hypothetical protein
MLIRKRTPVWVLAALTAGSIFASAGFAAPASAEFAEPEIALQVAAEEQQEAAAEATEAAVEQAEVAEARAEDLAFAGPLSFRTKAAEQYPAMYARIPRIEARIARLLAQKLALRELPQHSKRRKAFLPRKHARIMEERVRLAEVHKKIRAKKQALHA